MVVGIVTMQWAGLDDRGLDLRQMQKIFIFSKNSSSALGPFRPPAHWVLVIFSRGKVARV
jgi:hypothetical protein